MTKTIINIEEDLWKAFKKSIPTDLHISRAVSLLIEHYMDMGDSGKVLMNRLADKYGADKKQIRALFLKVKDKNECTIKPF